MENIKPARQLVERANRLAEEGLGDELAALDVAELTAELDELGELTDEPELARFLVLIRELADRTIGLRPFDVQLQAAAAMLEGISVEVATGEGKTLIGAIVAAGWVLQGRRVHVLSANDYLAQRDAAWMGPLLEASGASVATVTSTTPHADRVAAYRADVVYVPVTEAGFDVLRDRVRSRPEELVGISQDATVLDEADAVLLDEAKTPLVLAGEAGANPELDLSVADFVADLAEGVDFEVDDDRRTLHLTDAGIGRVEDWAPDADLFSDGADVLTRVNVALYARALLRRDVDYVLADGSVSLVSSSRGRIDALQRWPEGLQQAVEAKERLAGSAGVQVLDQLLVRDLVTGYRSVVGMSGTLVSSAEELMELYEIRSGSIEPNVPNIRTDEHDRLYETIDERDAAAVAFIADLYDDDQPVLVATQSVAESERFHRLLTEADLPAVLLNAKNDQEEADIIARAGEPGRITVSTQMAGRGTDIKLADGGAEAGGLCVVGIERFPNPRLDNQLRGRAGRQGDPGHSVFFTSLEDALLREFLPDTPEARDVLEADGLVLDRKHAGFIDQAQRISDGQQREQRSLARRYANLPAQQRLEIVKVRRDLMTDDRALERLRQKIPERIEELAEQVSAEELENAARTAVLSSLDERWSAHLAYALEIREGIHLQALGKQEPLTVYNRLLHEAFPDLLQDALGTAVELFEDAEVVDGRIDLDSAGLYRPGATWTYMVTDDHFGSDWNRIGRLLRPARR